MSRVVCQHAFCALRVVVRAMVLLLLLLLE
jgi:hypothetical protein